MKKLTIIWVLLAAVLGAELLITGCTNSEPADKKETQEGAVQKSSAKTEMPAGAVQGIQYTCTMHPEVISEKPGKCPKCGMDLVAKK